jgi:hypothetical protein
MEKRGGAFRTVIAVLAACLVLTGCGNSNEPEGPDTLGGGAASAEIIAQAKEREWVIAQSGTGAVVDGKDTGFTGSRIPVFRALETLREQGWKITSQWMGSDEEVVQSTLQGSVDFAYVPFTSIVAAATSGAPLKMFSAGTALDFVLVGTSEISGPEDMDGRSIAYAGPISSGALAARLYAAKAPGVTPVYLTIQGNSARSTGLLTGEIDVIAARLGVEKDIFEAAGDPDKFKILYTPLDDYPFLIDLTLSYNSLSCDDLCKAFAQQFTLEQVRLNREIIDDPSLITTWMAEYDAISSDERAAGLYYPDAGITAAVADQMIELLVDNEQLPPGSPPTGAEVVDETVWTAIADQVDAS